MQKGLSILLAVSSSQFCKSGYSLRFDTTDARAVRPYKSLLVSLFYNLLVLLPALDL